MRCFCFLTILSSIARISVPNKLLIKTQLSDRQKVMKLKYFRHYIFFDKGNCLEILNHFRLIPVCHTHSIKERICAVTESFLKSLNSFKFLNVMILSTTCAHEKRKSENESRNTGENPKTQFSQF